ncbi:hypothetical protein pb186bvf_020485 [Paramecium bursaria]
MSDEFYEQKIKALEINAKQFYSQLKPLFTENAQLKSHMIGLNYFIEERKIQLSKLVSDIGQNGEDRVIVKAVADLKQICDLVEEEFSKNQQIIIENKENNDQFKLEIKDLKFKIQQQDERHFEEKQQLIDQNRRASQYHRQVVDRYSQQVVQQKMRIEDLLSHLLEQKNREKQMQLDFEAQLKQKTLKLTRQLEDMKLYQTQLQEQFDNERRAYLKQLEQLSQRLNDAKEEIIQQYEYRLASQKLRMDDQIQGLLIDLKDHKTQIKNLEDQLKNSLIQQDKLTRQSETFKKLHDDMEFKLYSAEDNVNKKEQIIINLKLDIEQYKDQLDKLRNESITIKEEMKNLKKKSNQNIITPDKTSSKQELVEGLTNANKQINSTKQSVQQSESSKQDQFFKYDDLKSQKDESVVETKSGFHQLDASEIVNEKSKVQVVFVDTEMQTDEVFEDKQVKLDQLDKLDTRLRYNFTHESIQVDLKSSKRDKHEIELQNLNDQINILYNQNIKLKQELDEDTKNQELEINQIKRDVQKQFHKQFQELEDLHKEQLSSKDRIIEKIKEQNMDLEDRIMILEQTVDEKNWQIQDIQTNLMSRMELKDKEIQQIDFEKQIIQTQAQKEQERLLDLGQQIKTHLQQEIVNLQNQHILDQEIIKQERQKYDQERQDNILFKIETKGLIDQVKSKEVLLDSYRKELMKSTEIVKYLQLELENYKKMHNIFKPKQDLNIVTGGNGMGFLPVEIQDKIKMKLSKLNKKELLQKDRDLYALNYNHQRNIKMKQGRTQQLLVNQSQDLQQELSKYNMFKGKFETEQEFPKVVTRRNRNISQDHSFSDIKQLQGRKAPYHARSKTQMDEYEEETAKVMKDIDKKEQILLQHSKQLLQSMNSLSTNNKFSQKMSNRIINRIQLQ